MITDRDRLVQKLMQLAERQLIIRVLTTPKKEDRGGSIPGDTEICFLTLDVPRENQNQALIQIAYRFESNYFNPGRPDTSSLVLTIYEEAQPAFYDVVDKWHTGWQRDSLFFGSRALYDGCTIELNDPHTIFMLEHMSRIQGLFMRTPRIKIFGSMRERSAKNAAKIFHKRTDGLMQAIRFKLAQASTAVSVTG